MKIRYERPVSHAATWAGRFGVFAFTLFLVSAAMHRFGVLETDFFAAVFVLSGAIAALAFLLAAVGLLRLWMVGAKGGRASAKGMFFSILVLIPVCLTLYRIYTLPQLHDISTDIVNVPDFLEPVDHSMGWLPVIGGSASAYAGQAEAYPEVTGRRYEGAVDRVLEAVYLVAEKSGIRITQAKLPEQAEDNGEEAPAGDDSDSSVIEMASEAIEVADEPIDPDVSLDPDETPASASEETTDQPVASDSPPPPDTLAESDSPEAGEPLPLEGSGEGAVEPVVTVPVEILLQGETRTLLFGFESDVSIRLSEEAETTFVDMRSVSRSGPHDLGANARIIADFLATLDAELLGISVR